MIIHDLSAFDTVDFNAGAIFLVDKPFGWTSFDVVNKLRFKIRKYSGNKRIKVGHAGTLDPMATGLLIIGVGKGTKELQTFQDLNKQYEGSLLLGASTPSYDAETEPDQICGIGHIGEKDIFDATQSFVGKIEQIPPSYSALRVGGERAYKLVRKGQEVQLNPRMIEIYSFEIIRIEMPTVHFSVYCQKGTYIRTLAHDFGHHLESAAHLTSLKRVAIGNHLLQSAFSIDEILNAMEKK